MKERIREIAEQAGLEFDDDLALEPEPIYYITQKELEKFAELIILECANRVNGMVVMDKGHIPQDPHSQGWNSAVAYAGKELKKHFGVES
jgi:hypothetical protein